MHTDPHSTGLGGRTPNRRCGAAGSTWLAAGWLAAGLTGCGPETGLTRDQADTLIEERDRAVARVQVLEADILDMKKKQLQLAAETEDAAEEADRLIADLVDENQHGQDRIHRLTARLDEARSEEFADVIRLHDGQEIICRVLDLRGNIAEVQLPDGSRKKARLADIQQILLRSTSDFEVIPELEPIAEFTPQESFEPVGSDRKLELSPFWNIPLPASTRSTQALRQMLSPYGRPRLDLDGRPGAVLCQSVYYLMPLEAAQTALGQKTAQRTEVVVPGLPKNSFFIYEYDGFFEGKFNRLLLVTDNAAQVVAIQLVEDAPRGRWLDPDLPAGMSKVYDSSLDLFNIIENRTKSISRGLIGIDVTRLNRDVIRIDSEFLSSQRNSKECVRLYVAQPVVDLILHLIDTFY